MTALLDPVPDVAAPRKSADNSSSQVGRTGPVSRSSHGVPPATFRSDRDLGGPPPSIKDSPSHIDPLIHSSNNPLIPDPSIQPSTNPATDHAQTSSASNTSDPIREISEIRGSDENTNRTFPDETPPRSKNRPLYHNDFRVPRPNRRPVLPSENDHANGNGNGNGHVNGNGRLP